MEHEPDVEARLRTMGTLPVEPGVETAHLARIARAERASLRKAKARVAAIVAAGVLVGTTGLAAAGALPDPAQHVAHRALGGVGVDVPDPERYHGSECGAEVKKNHGAYVRDDHDLAGSRCGKPIQAGQDGDDDGKASKAEKGPCEGSPPWAGKNKASMTPAEKAKAQSDREALCGVEDATEGDPEATEREASTTTTTAAPSTTIETTTTTGSTSTTAPTDPTQPEDPPTGA